MQEFILYSQIPADREQQVLNIFAGLTGAQPVAIHEQHLIFAQLKVPDTPALSKRGGGGGGGAGPSRSSAASTPNPQNLRPQYQKLIRDVRTPRENNGNDPAPDGPLSPAQQPWLLRTEHVPEPGAAVIARAATETPASPADIARLRTRDAARFVTQYTTTGHRFVHGNVVIRVCRMWVRARNGKSGDGGGGREGEGGEKKKEGEKGEAGEEEDVIEAPPPSLEALALVDASGAWMVEAAVRAEDGGNARVTAAATRELQGFAAEMVGAVNLVAPDRLALDTRVKNV